MIELVNVSVEKISGGWYVRDHTGEVLIGYRNKKNAELFAYGHAIGIYGEAERYNERRDYCRAYLENRAKRVPIVPAQFEMF